MKQYVDSCLTYEILLQDSGLIEKPREDWNTFVPQSGDIAHVDQDEKDYIFNGEEWIEYVEEEPEELETESEEMISGNIDLDEETPEIESQDVFVSEEPVEEPIDEPLDEGESLEEPLPEEPLPEEPSDESVNVEGDSAPTLEDSQDTNEEEPVSEEPSSEEEPLEEPVPEEEPHEELVEGE